MISAFFRTGKVGVALEVLNGVHGDLVPIADLTKYHGPAPFTGDSLDAIRATQKITASPVAKAAAAALAGAKAAKLKSLEGAAISPVAVGGLSIATDTDTQQKFTTLTTGITHTQSTLSGDALTAFNAQNISAVAGPIVDSAGALHDMTVQAAYALAGQYLQAIGSARANFYAKAALVAAATTIEAVNAIS